MGSTADDPFPSIWTKYIFIASFGLVTAYKNKSVGAVFEDMESKNLVRQIMQEILNIANAKGIKLSNQIIEESLLKAKNFPYDTKTSYQRDIELKGKVNEGDLFGGTILREAKFYDVPAPMTASLYSGIQSRFSG